jgi:hypothetical protein
VTELLEASGDEVERDLLGLMLRSNAERLADCLRQAPTTDQGAVIAALAAATGLGSVLDDIVVALVHQARSEGNSWASIGDALQVSRQAAFQRFATASGEAPETGGTVLAEAPERATRALLQFLARDFDALRADFNQRMTEGCPVSLLKSVRSRLTKQLGEVRGIGDPAVVSLGSYTVVDIPIAYKKGERNARIALEADARIAGFFVLNANVPSQEQ